MSVFILHFIHFNDFCSSAILKPLEYSVRFNKHAVKITSLWCRILRIPSTTAYDIPKIDKNIQFETLFIESLVYVHKLTIFSTHIRRYFVVGYTCSRNALTMKLIV